MPAMPRDRPREDDVGTISDRLELGPVDPEARRRRRRSRLIRRILLITALVVGLGGGIVFVQLRSKTTVVTIDDSVSRFREASPAVAVAGVPESGVYVYATEGRDEITVLGGSHHDYPAETTLTVTAEGCGARLRWDALGERWEEWVICPDGPRLEIRSISTYHQFFGKSDHRDYFCGEDSLYRPVELRRGATWTSVCSGPDATATARGEVVGVEFLAVGGTRVRSIHFEIVTTFEGTTVGSRTTEVWMVAATGLPIITISHDDLDTDSVLGRTHYVERYRTELRSLEPRT